MSDTQFVQESNDNAIEYKQGYALYKKGKRLFGYSGFIFIASVILGFTNLIPNLIPSFYPVLLYMIGVLVLQQAAINLLKAFSLVQTSLGKETENTSYWMESALHARKELHKFHLAYNDRQIEIRSLNNQLRKALRELYTLKQS